MSYGTFQVMVIQYCGILISLSYIQYRTSHASRCVAASIIPNHPFPLAHFTPHGSCPSRSLSSSKSGKVMPCALQYPCRAIQTNRKGKFENSYSTLDDRDPENATSACLYNRTRRYTKEILRKMRAKMPQIPAQIQIFTALATHDRNCVLVRSIVSSASVET